MWIDIPLDSEELEVIIRLLLQSGQDRTAKKFVDEYKKRMEEKK